MRKVVVRFRRESGAGIQSLRYECLRLVENSPKAVVVFFPRCLSRHLYWHPFTLAWQHHPATVAIPNPNTSRSTRVKSYACSNYTQTRVTIPIKIIASSKVCLWSVNDVIRQRNQFNWTRNRYTHTPFIFLCFSFLPKHKGGRKNRRGMMEI